MNRPVLALLLLAQGPAFGEEHVDLWPVHMVPTAKLLGLSGQPKVVKLFDGIANQSGVSKTYKFHRNGQLQQQVSGDGGRNILVKHGRGGVIQAVIDSSLDNGSTDNAETYRPQKYDANRRVTVITSESREGNGTTFRVNGIGVRLLTYTGNIHTEDRYYKAGDQIGPGHRTRTEYDAGGNVVAQCWGGAIGQPCDRDGTIMEYGPYGMTRYKAGAVETLYRYEKGLLVSTVRSEPALSATPEVVNYGAYRVDACGNWVEREFIPAPPQQRIRERREITYHEGCDTSR